MEKDKRKIKASFQIFRSNLTFFNRAELLRPALEHVRVQQREYQEQWLQHRQQQIQQSQNAGNVEPRVAIVNSASDVDVETLATLKVVKKTLEEQVKQVNRTIILVKDRNNLINQGCCTLGRGNKEKNICRESIDGHAEDYESREHTEDGRDHQEAENRQRKPPTTIHASSGQDRILGEAIETIQSRKTSIREPIRRESEHLYYILQMIQF
jgi:hypothetical protein